MEIPGKIIEHFLDQNKRLSSKLSVCIICIVSLIIIDNIFFFSESYVIEKKLNHIQKINSILSDSVTDHKTSEKFIDLREYIIEQENYFSKGKNLILDFYEYRFQNNKHESNVENSSKPNIIIFHLSVSAIWYCLAFLSFVTLLFDTENTIVSRIAGGILFSSVFTLIGFIFYWICSFIPLIYNTWPFNYVLNAIIQSIVIYFIYKWLSK